jgi:hypothetical protein
VSGTLPEADIHQGRQAMHPLLLGILTKAPDIIVIAKKLADSVKTVRKNVEVAERVSALEKNEVQQAELVKAMAKQLNDMAAVIKVLHSRFLICLSCSIIALVLAAIALWHDYAN